MTQMLCYNLHMTKRPILFISALVFLALLVSCKSTAIVSTGEPVDIVIAEEPSRSTPEPVQTTETVPGIASEPVAEKEPAAASEAVSTAEPATSEASQTPETEKPAEEQMIAQNEEVVEESSVTSAIWDIGQTGPYGNIVFECNGRYLEIAEPVYEVDFESAVQYCTELSTGNAQYRLPEVDELLCIYGQLLEEELIDIDWTYYWSCEEVDESTVRIVNFDTGFEGSFYRDLDFISAIPVVEIS